MNCRLTPGEVSGFAIYPTPEVQKNKNHFSQILINSQYYNPTKYKVLKETYLLLSTKQGNYQYTLRITETISTHKLLAQSPT